jgi:hypothetical protein
MSERTLRTNIVKALTNYSGYWTVLHQSGTQEKGLPDIIGCYAGTFYGLEVKLPGKLYTLTPRQSYVLAKIEAAGGKSLAVTSVEQAMAFVFGD